MNLSLNMIFPSRKAKSSNQCSTHRVDLIENLPLLVRDPQGLGRLDRPLQLACPHLQVNNLLLLDELLQRLSKLQNKPGEVGREQELPPPFKASFQGCRSKIQLPPTGLGCRTRLCRCSHDTGQIQQPRCCQTRTCFPRGDRPESPPILPTRLYSLSPCRQR